MLANANCNYICLMQNGTIKLLYAAKGGVSFAGALAMANRTREEGELL